MSIITMEQGFLIGKFYFDPQKRCFNFSTLENPDVFYHMGYDQMNIKTWILRVMHCFREKTTFSFRYNEETKEVIELW